MKRTSCQFFLFIVLIAAVFQPAFAAEPNIEATSSAMLSEQADVQAVQPDSKTEEKDNINWLELVINILGSGLLCAVINYLLDLRKERRSRILALIDSLFDAFNRHFTSDFFAHDDSNLTAFQEEFQNFLSEQRDTLKLLQRNKRCKEVIDTFTLDKLLNCAQDYEKERAGTAILEFASEIYANLMGCVKLI